MRISLRDFAENAAAQRASALYAIAKPELDPSVAAKERRTRSRLNDRQEREFYRQDTADIYDMAA